MSRILDTRFMHPSDQIALIIERIYKRRLTTTSGGNISIIDENGDIWITPSAVDKGSLKSSDIMCVRKNGTIEGKHKPSSEYPFHKSIYESRPDIKSIIHAHPPALVSFSIVRQTPNTNIFPQAKHACGIVGYAAYEVPGSYALGKMIAAEFDKGFSSVIMENHGTVIGGADIADAFQRFETLEFTARSILYGNQIGTPNYLTEEQIKFYEENSSSNFPVLENPEYLPDEQKIRREICNIVQRACDQGLMISSYGTVSCRWKENDFLITPTGISRWDYHLNDIVQIKDGKCEAGKKPSRSVQLHYEIYKNNPKINSIIITQTPYLMAFGVTENNFNVRTIPESWIFLQDVNKLPFESLITETEKISKGFNKNPAVIINNNYFIVTGNKLLQTFDYLEVAEFSAKSLVMGASLGNLVPINDEQVEDLRNAFLS
jgi:L-fuculose-phosphate aldolase